MSEYWKSTPKYWCKHCSTYVKDTKLERTNHEATGKHQGALKRFLRDLHREHEHEQRDKDRAKREIERLNGVVGSSSRSASDTASTSYRTPSAAPSKGASQDDRRRQWEQLESMGISVPTELHGDMAMASGWTVTSTKVIDDAPPVTDDGEGNPKIQAVATGVRKRVKREGEEDEDDEAEALQGLYKKPKKWGRDSKSAPEDSAELEALLSGALVPKIEKKEDDDDQDNTKVLGDIPKIKTEDSHDDEDSVSKSTALPVSSGGEQLAAVKGEGQETPLPGAVVFKKRKAKNVRQK